MTTNLLDVFSESDRKVVVELLRRIVSNSNQDLNVISFLRHSDGTLLNTESPGDGPGGDGLMGSGSILQLMMPLIDRSTLTHNAFSFNPAALSYMRDRLNPPDSAIRAAIGAKAYHEHLAGNRRAELSTFALAEDLGVGQIRVGKQVLALAGVNAIKLAGTYYPEGDYVYLTLTSKGHAWALAGFPADISSAAMEVSVSVHVDVVATIRSVREDRSIDPQLKEQWEQLMRKLEESLEGISDESPFKAAVDVLDTASKAGGLFAKSVDFIHRHIDDIVRTGESIADSLPGS